MKLIEGGQLLVGELLIFGPKGSERCLQPLAQAGRAIVIAHAIKNTDHCSIPPGPEAQT
jgi:hypothetical protein